MITRQINMQVQPMKTKLVHAFHNLASSSNVLQSDIAHHLSQWNMTLCENIKPRWI